MTGLLLAGAAASAGTPEPANEEFSAARKTYVAKCAKCHKFYEPRDYDAGEWKRWMDAMSRKSNLKPDQEDLLRKYLEAYRAGKIQKLTR